MGTIRVRLDDWGNPCLLLEELIPGFEYEAVSYTMEVVDDNGIKKLVLKFFDKDDNIINVNLVKKVVDQVK